MPQARQVIASLWSKHKLAITGSMDPVLNPFAPGSGQVPPLLTGRDDTIGAFKIALSRVAANQPEKNFILSGLRGVGKTVLLRTAQNIATQDGIQTMILEAGDDRSLRGRLASRI